MLSIEEANSLSLLFFIFYFKNCFEQEKENTECEAGGQRRPANEGARRPGVYKDSCSSGRRQCREPRITNPSYTVAIADSASQLSDAGKP